MVSHSFVYKVNKFSVGFVSKLYFKFDIDVQNNLCSYLTWKMRSINDIVCMSDIIQFSKEEYVNFHVHI